MTRHTKTKRTVEGKYAVGNGVKTAVLCALAILLQVLWLYEALSHLSAQYGWIENIINLLAVLMVLVIYGQHKNASVKMPWIMLILAFPFFGVFLYGVIGNHGVNASARARYRRIDEQLLPLLPKNDQTMAALRQKDAGVAGQCHYLQQYTGYPVYQNTDVVFYPDSAAAYAEQLKQLAKAEHFIFIEYHAIEDSTAFEPLHEILRERARAGVEVRVFYDYVGSMGFVGNHFAKKLEADGIRCRVFNPMVPLLKVFLNNRDHRKITVIDGKVGFTGGYNLADEYFHLTTPYGHWLDTGVKLTGDAVKSLTVTFLENWNAIDSKDEQDSNFSSYLPDPAYSAAGHGFVQPYADSPLDDEQTGENVYINILRDARQYAYFTTPYLIITDEMNHAFAMAAKSGVDVRIITPGIPDKKLIYSVTRSYYAGLVKNGIRIYEYTPGFCHAKQCVADDKVAACGTINLDFRSLYHHFENGVLLYDCDAVQGIKTQFDQLFPQCCEVTEEYRTGRSRSLRLQQLILRLFAPLM